MGIIDKLIQLFQAIDFEPVLRVLMYDSRSPLLFNSGLFMLLFVAFLGIYQLLRRWRNVKLLFVILFSLYFYYKSSAGYCIILLGVCLSDYLIGLAIGKVGRTILGRILVALNVVINVGMLVYFKYINMIIDTFTSITGTHFDPLNIILPAGISFFCFRSISYVVDVYRGIMPPARNLLQYTFFLTFFPPLLAGPVVRARDLMPQIQANSPATHAMVSEGLVLIMAGLIKKVIIADFIAAGFIDRVFENPSLYSGFENLMAALGFAIQLYCDFSGYSDMAIGIALLLGYRFKINFRAPYKASSPSDFWHRWHISLSQWLRDYVYIPLGGNRCSRPRMHFNNMATMLIGGLWHGASWMYVLWGAYHGALLIVHKAISSIWHLPQKMKSWHIVKFTNVLITFVLMVIGMTIFRAPSLMHLGDMVSQIFGAFHPEVIPAFVSGYTMIVVAILTAYILHFMPSAWNDRTYSTFARLPFVVQAIIFAFVIFLTIQTRQSDLVPFIYLQY